MTGWFIFYFLSFSLLLAPKKVISILYPLIFWIFVGFRDNIGTDYTTTTEVIERSYMPFSDFVLNFTGYRFFDLEFVHKLITMTLASLDWELKLYFAILAGIEAIVISFILRNSRNTKIILIYFICLFSINYPMNTMRQGLCYLLVILAYFFEFNPKYKSKLKTNFSYVFGMLSHYASSVIVVLNIFKIRKVRTYIAIGIVLILIVQFVDLDLLSKRYVGAEGKYGLRGFGLRMYVFLLYYLYASKKLVNRSFLSQETITLMMVLMMFYIKDPFVRLYNFYVYLLCFKNVLEADNKKIVNGKFWTAITFPFMAWICELIEIYRTPELSTTGVWFPYSNWLF